MAPPPAAAAVAADPIAGFLATAAPGASGQAGSAGEVRLARAYNAASGRECREVLVGRGGEERSAVYCRAGEGWVAARPLLRGGTARP